MDKIDESILKEITKNAQTPFLKVADKLGISSKTVKERYEKMKKNGIILRQTITLDLSKIGYQGKAYLAITNSPDQDRATTIRALKRVPNIFMITEIVGDFDILALAVIRDLNSSINLVKEIREIPSVQQVQVALVADASFPVGERFSELFIRETH